MPQSVNVRRKPASRWRLPTSITKAYVYGPLFHYEDVTDDQAARLGVAMLPAARFRCSTSGPGWEARRLKNGALRVILAAHRVRDEGAARFIETMQRYAADHSRRRPTR